MSVDIKTFHGVVLAVIAFAMTVAALAPVFWGEEPKYSLLVTAIAAITPGLPMPGKTKPQ